jgi:hypothetical protein
MSQWTQAFMLTVQSIMLHTVLNNASARQNTMDHPVKMQPLDSSVGKIQQLKKKTKKTVSHALKTSLVTLYHAVVIEEVKHATQKLDTAL